MNCPECGVPCHEDGTCPKCGGVYYIVKKEKRGSRGKGGGAGFLVLVAVVVSGLFYLLAKTPGCSSSSPPADRAGTFTVQPNTLGCETLDDYNQLARLAGDLPAFERSMRESVLKGVCRWLPVGEKAFMEDYKMTADAAKVRVQGESQSYWIPGRSAK